MRTIFIVDNEKYIIDNDKIIAIFTEKFITRSDYSLIYVLLNGGHKITLCIDGKNVEDLNNRSLRALKNLYNFWNGEDLSDIERIL